MSPKPFYEVAPHTYLFQKQETPEEKVRQWAAFELLSTYGYHINDLQFEKPVKVGRRTHYADIVIYRNQKPLIAIECKRMDDTKRDDGIKQAISYATAFEVQAEFAVHTNGITWDVYRNNDNNWVSIIDIPTKEFVNTDDYLASLIFEIELLRPILYWTYRSVPAKEAQTFFKHLQEFFLAQTLTLKEIDTDLTSATESLLRPLVVNPNKDAHYAFSKTTIASKLFLKFFEKENISFDMFDPEFLDVDQQLLALQIRFEEIYKNNKNSSSTVLI